MATPEQSYFDPAVLARLSNLHLKARWVVEGVMAGLHRSRAKGFSVEFEQHREYAPGDEIRRIDWKALGKLDRYFIKEYEDESNLKTHLLLDVSGSMDYASGEITKFQYACILVASLAYLILRQQDAAGLTTFSDRIDSQLPPKATRGYMVELLQRLEAETTRGETDVGRILREVAGGIRRRGLVVLVSDLLDDAESVLQGLRLFRYKGNDVLVFHVLDETELTLPFSGNTRFEDIEDPGLRVTADPKAIQAEYRRVMENHIDTLRSGCHEYAIDYQLVSTATPLDQALVSYLSWRK